MVVQLVAFGDLEALLGRVEDGLDLLDEPIFLLLELGVLLDGLLDEQLNVAQLAEVEIALALQPDDCLLQGIVLGLESRAGSTAASSLGDARAAGSWGGATGTSGCRASGGGTRGRAAAGGESTAFSPTNSIIIAAGVVLIPKLLCPLEEVEVVLHSALNELLDGDRLVDLMLCEGVWTKTGWLVKIKACGQRNVLGRGLTLEDLEVLDVGIFAVDVELYAGHGNVEEDAVVHLAERSAVGNPGVSKNVVTGPQETDEIIDAIEGRQIYLETHPVPHCSTFVMLSCRRLLSHCTSSCL